MRMIEYLYEWIIIFDYRYRVYQWFWLNLEQWLFLCHISPLLMGVPVFEAAWFSLEIGLNLYIKLSLSKSLKHIVNPFEYELDLMQRLFDKWLWNCVSGEDELQLNISYASMKHFSSSFIHFLFSSYWRNWNYIFDTQGFSN